MRTRANTGGWLMAALAGMVGLAPAAAEAQPAPPRDLRQELAHTLGVSRMAPPLSPRSRVTESVTAGAYRRERVELEVEPDDWAPACVFVPTHGRPVATIIALHGHGPGKVLTIGITRNPWEREAVQVHQRGFGKRMHPDDTGHALNSCPRLHANALAHGRSLIGERVYDVQQWMAYAATRPEMDASRLGVLGHSAGGTTALFTAALDPRVRVAVVSGYFGTWRESVVDVPHCVCDEVPGIEHVAALADVACLIAPRPLLLSLGAKDEWMPAAPARRAFPAVHACFAPHGAERVRLRFGPGGHQVYGTHVWPFLTEHLPPESPPAPAPDPVHG